MEAAKHGNQIYKLKSEDGDFIKLKHSYSQPDLRSLYLTALHGLLNSKLVRQVFASDCIELYEMTFEGKAFTSLTSAAEQIMQELATSGRVFKVHSAKGEFVQCGSNSFNKIDSERILYLQALRHLLHHGSVRIASESREMATYELDLTNKIYCDLSQRNELGKPDQFAA